MIIIDVQRAEMEENSLAEQAGRLCRLKEATEALGRELAELSGMDEIRAILRRHASAMEEEAVSFRQMTVCMAEVISACVRREETVLSYLDEVQIQEKQETAWMEIPEWMRDVFG